MPDRYRFRGHTPPKSGARASVLNFTPTAETGDGDATATLRLYDPIDSWGGDWGVSAKEFALALAALPAEVNEIRLHINSPGGEVFEAVAILNMLRQHKSRVVAVVDGLAASAASFLAAGADELIMGDNSTLMIHDAWGLCVGNAGDMRNVAERLDMLSDNIASIYAKKAGGTDEEWRAAMLAESWYSATESVAAGLADSVAGAPSDSGDENRFDLSQFHYAGRNEAPPPVIPAPDVPPNITINIDSDSAVDAEALAADLRRRLNLRKRSPRGL